MISNSKQSSPQLILEDVAQYVKHVDITQHDEAGTNLVLLKSIASALKRQSTTKSDKFALDQGEVTQKLLQLIERNISQYASKLKKSQGVAEDDAEVLRLDMTLSALDCVKDDLSANPIKLSSKTVARLQSAADVLVLEGSKAGWKLKTFLIYNQKTHTSGALMEQLGQAYPKNTDAHLVFDFVDAITDGMDGSARLELLYRAMENSASWKSPDVPYLAIERIVDTTQGKLSVYM
jgi:hypothetical protein